MSSKIGSDEAEIFDLLGQLEDVQSRLEKALQIAAGEGEFSLLLVRAIQNTTIQTSKRFLR